MYGSILLNFPNFEPKLAQTSENFAQCLAQNWPDWYMNGSLFLEKIGICMGLLSNFMAGHSYQNQTGVPPGNPCPAVVLKRGLKNVEDHPMYHNYITLDNRPPGGYLSLCVYINVHMHH